MHVIDDDQFGIGHDRWIDGICFNFFFGVVADIELLGNLRYIKYFQDRLAGLIRIGDTDQHRDTALILCQ